MCAHLHSGGMAFLVALLVSGRNEEMKKKNSVWGTDRGGKQGNRNGLLGIG